MPVSLKKQILAYSKKLLAMSTKNKLIHSSFSSRGQGFRFIDELPQKLAEKLSRGMTFKPLPPLDTEPPEEKTPKFKRRVEKLRITDETYLDELKKIDDKDIDDPDEITELEADCLRALKDRVREELGLPPRVTGKGESDLREHARRHGLDPSYDLPEATEEAQEIARYNDSKIQTLFLPEVLEANLSKIKQKFESDLTETGQNTLYITFGFLEWTQHLGTANEKKRLAPLLLMQVEFNREKKNFKIKAIDENEILGNETLRLYLEQDFGWKLPKLPKRKEGEDIIDIEKYLKRVHTKAKRDKGWRVLRRTSVGIFYTQELTMHEDLKVIAENPNDLLKALLGGRGISGTDEIYDVDEEEYSQLIPALIEPADSSQHSVVIDMLKESSFVVRGPPGTGKSQTICNMIAACMYVGKRVLFVADKEAALEVVRTRLKAAGLDDYVLKLYSSKASKQKFFDSIKTRINGKKPNPVSINLNSAVEKLKSVRNQLNKYKDFVGSEFGKTGITVHTLLWEQEIFGKKYPVNEYLKIEFPDSKKLTKEEKKSCILVFDEIETQYGKIFNDISYEDHPWRTAQKPPATTIENNRFKDLVDAWDESFKNLIDSHKLLEKKGIGTNASTLRKSRTTLQLIDKYNFSEEGVVPGFGSRLALTLLSLSSEKLESCEGLITTIREIDKKEVLLGDANIEERSIDDINDLIVGSENYLQNNQAFNELEPLLDEKNKEKEKLDNVIPKLSEFRDTLEIEEGLTKGFIESLIILNAIIKQDGLNTDLLQNLSNNLLNADYVIKLGKLKQIQESKQEFLAKQIKLDYLDKPADLRKAALIINSASLFSYLKKEYWGARKVFSKVSDKPYTSSEKVELLDKVAKYLELKNALEQDQDLNDIFGRMFDGVNTDTAPVISLSKFMGNVGSLDVRLKRTELFNTLNNTPKQFVEALELLEIENLEHFLTIDFGENEDLIATNSSYADSISSLDGLILLSRKLNISDLNSESLKAYKETIDNLKEERTELKENGDLIFSEGQLDLELIRSKVEEVESWINSLLDFEEQQRQYFSNNITTFIDSRELLADFCKAYKESNSKLKEASSIVEAALFNGNKFKDVSLDEQLIFFNKHVRKDTLIDFFTFKKEEQNLPLGPVTNFYNAYKEKEKNVNEISSFFRSWLAQKQYETLILGDDEKALLQTYKGKKLDSLVKQLKTLDKEIETLIRKDVASKANELSQSSPPGRGGLASEKTEQEFLEHCAALKTFPKGSVRNNLNRSLKALSFNLPCWMMIPPNISTYLPPKDLFDVLIIDEASQMSPPRALPALARAKQCIIVGDEHQLPPSGFFKRREDGEDESIDVQESILDLAKTVWRKPRMLRWHYRSNHQDLIRFQNNFIYDNYLIIPPSITEAGSSHLGVHSHYLEGAIYRGAGTNDDEVEKIKELIKEHVEQRPHLSLGVAVMNIRQKDNVFQEINFMKQDFPELRKFEDSWSTKQEGLNKFFVKNLENVQGDERDVIIIGTGFGRLKEGAPVHQIFTPINQAGGERRLNVITTRARDSLHLVTSLMSSDVDPKVPGTRFLSEYLSYAKTKELPLGIATGEEPDSPFEEWAIEQVESFGFEAIPQVGVEGFKIDIGVKHPEADGYILAIECDGATYHSSSAARDRDLLRQQLLESFGWKFHRIWSTDWIWEPGRTREALKKALDTALKEAKERTDENIN